MLLFILSIFSPSTPESYFNTSHVTVYPLAFRLSEDSWRYFNTSHVTVYRTDMPRISSKHLFQYISCYCLSRDYAAKNNIVIHFNTSHVTVYRKLEYRKDFGKGFQYISCYCLSYFKWSECCKIYGFQYISCYCLSEKKQLPDIDIDLFQYISCYCLSKW